MTHINHISISDFKSIDKLEIDVGMLNIITGGNNAGKTSLLQALDLVFNPASISDYEDDVSHLINVHATKAEISVRYVEGGQTSILEFMDKQGPPETAIDRKLKIVEPKDKQKVEILVEAALQVATTGPNAEYLVDRFTGRTLQLNLEDEDTTELINNAVGGALTEIPEDRMLSWVKGNTVILELDGESYPYVYLGGFYEDFKESVIDKAKSNILREMGRMEEPLVDGEENELSTVLERTLNDLMVPRFGRGRFLDGEPPSVSGVRFVKNSVQLTQDDVDMERENAAVRMSNIADYLKENAIVENLDTLSIDQIVFNPENGEKYQVPYSFMGDGFKAMIGVLWELSDAHRRKDVLLLEEAENHMHPEYIHQLSYHLTEILARTGIQVFITTHNIDLIKSFLEIPDKELEEYLIENFKLLKMDPDFPEEYDYLGAKRNATNLQLDLRG